MIEVVFGQSRTVVKGREGDDMEQEGRERKGRKGREGREEK